MNYETYKKILKQLNVGKKLPDAIYIHKSAFDALPSELMNLIKMNIKRFKLAKKRWNILKLFKNSFSFSLLYYPKFFTDPYPELRRSYFIDLRVEKLREIDYSKSKNPPILHRKETFITKENPYYEKFSKHTKEGEKLGLYQNSKKIGYKQQWSELISSKGLTISNESSIKLNKIINKNEQLN